MSSMTSAAAAERSSDHPRGFYELAPTRPDVPAIISPDGTRLTFGVLARRVNRISRALRAHGIAPGGTFGVIVHNGPEYLELMLAAGQIGALMVPINWRLAAGELLYILRDSAAEVLITDAGQARELPVDELPPHRYAIGGDVLGWSPYAALGAGESDDPPAGRRLGGWMAYTSGTTGHPKGVRNNLPDAEPESVASQLATMPRRYGIDPGPGVHLVVAPLYHAAPGGHALAFLHAGHTIVIHDRFDAERVLRDVERYRVTSTHMVPTHFHRMLQLPDDVRAAYDLTSLQAVVHAGAPCPVPIKQRMIEWLGPIVWEYLGSTEGLVSQVDSEEWLTKPGTVGRPLAGLTVRILDDGEEVATGQPGTIYFGVPGRAPSFAYHHDPEKTAAGRHGDLVTAGDYGYFDDDGYLFMLDRRTDLIISGGVNIYPAEIEQQLITHPAVNDVAVIGVPDREWGQQVVAVVQPVEGVDAGPRLAQRLLEHCAPNLASFKRPRRIEFVDDFPRTEAGKVQRRVLRETYAQRTDT
jgi:long-chain acyl-CoA synthetase